MTSLSKRVWAAARISSTLDPQTAATARFTIVVSVVSCLGVVGYTLVSLVLGPAPLHLYAVAAAYLAAGVAACLGVRHGHLRLATHLVVLQSFGAATYFVVVEGPETRHLGIYFVALIAAGLLTSPRAAALYGAAGSFVLVAVALLVDGGYYRPPAPIPEHAWTQVVAQLLVAGFLTALLVRGLWSAHQKLARSEKKLGRLIANSPDGIILLDADGQCVDVNPAAESLLGRTRADLLGKSVNRTGLFESGGFDPGAFEDGVWNARLPSANEEVTLEVNGIRLSGDPEGTPGFELVLRDITAREREHAERSRLQSELLRSQKTEALGRLAGGVAHDFNNFLTVVLANAELLRLGGLSRTEVNQRADEIREAGEKAAEVTKQLLAFGRKGPSPKRDVDIREVVSGIERMGRRFLGESTSLELSLPQTPVRVSADPVRLEQVLVNLLVNASDAMPTGGKLSVQVEGVHADVDPALDSDREWAMIRVADTGVGMSPQEVERAFEPFFSTKPEGAGTGLGLSTVSLIVQDLGGHVRVDSERGVGTSFTIYIPSLAGVCESSEGDATTKEALASHATGNGQLLCVVDDDAGVRGVVERALASKGFRVVAGDSWEAVEKRLGGEPTAPMLLVTDVVLEGNSGADVAKRFASRYKRPVLFISGYTGSVLDGYGVLGNEIELLPKPFSVDQLLTRVNQLLVAK